MSNDLALIRCQKQFLTGTPSTTAVQIVEWFGAVQAQDFGGALWAIGQRSDGLTAEDVHQAIAQRQIVRTWPLRGTIHFVPAADLRWMIALTGKRQNERSWSILRSMGLDLPILEHGRKVLEKVLRDGPLTRPEIYAGLEGDGIATAKGAGLHILSYWAQEGLICFGLHRGKQPTFVLLDDDWLAAVDSRVLDRDAALETLAMRYFQSHGPATDRDFAWWSGLPLTEARAAMRLLGGRLEKQVTGDTTLWSAPEVAAYAPPSGDVLRLLSPFDELLVAYKDRSAYDRVSDANEAITFFQPSLLLNGSLVGSWQKALGPKSGIVHLHFAADMAPVKPALIEAQLARLSDFHGLPMLHEA